MENEYQISLTGEEVQFLCDFLLDFSEALAAFDAISSDSIEMRGINIYNLSGKIWLQTHNEDAELCQIIPVHPETVQ